jgi:hypothetical protein
MGLMLDSLQRALAQEIAKRGKDAPFARDLRAQIASIERQQRRAAGLEKPRENPVSFRGE